MSAEFSTGNVLGAGFKIWFKNLIPFLLMTAVIYLPVIIWGLWLVHGDIDDARLKSINTFAKLQGALTIPLNTFVTATLTYGVVMELQGQRASIGKCMSTGLSRLLPTLGVSILSALAIGGGFVLLIIPGLIFACMLYVAAPVAVLEKPGVLASLKRSRELTAGKKGSLFGVLFLIGLIGIGFTQVEKHLLVPSDPYEAFKALPRLMYVNIAHLLLLGSLGAVMGAVAYYMLRKDKEGTSVTELAKVFE